MIGEGVGSGEWGVIGVVVVVVVGGVVVVVVVVYSARCAHAE